MFTHIPSFIPNQVIVIGAGGTGSRLMPMLTQFLRSISREHNPKGWLINPRVVVIDDDTVEQKNLLRQNFIAQDIGKPKALVVAQRYANAYGVRVEPVIARWDRSFLSKKDSSVIFEDGYNLHNSIVVLAVDSIKARQDILHSLLTAGVVREYAGRNIFLIDAGNEDDFGQVRWSHLGMMMRPSDTWLSQNKPLDMYPVSSEIDFIPLDLQYYDEMTEGPSRRSCADLDQTLAINAIMATTIMGAIQNFYFRKPFTYCQANISLATGCGTDFNTYTRFRNSSIPFDKARGNPFPNIGVTWDILKHMTADSNRLTAYYHANEEELARMRPAVPAVAPAEAAPTPVPSAAKKPRKKPVTASESAESASTPTLPDGMTAPPPLQVARR